MIIPSFLSKNSLEEESKNEEIIGDIESFKEENSSMNKGMFNGTNYRLKSRT